VQGTVNSSSGGFQNNVYIFAYRGIARANDFISNLNSASITGLTDSLKKSYEAEARMLRAYFYSYLYRCYGSVIITDKPLTLETQNIAKSSAVDVLAFMMTDLESAITNLAETSYNGHWTKDAARAMKARMLLYDAYDDTGNAITQKMTDAEALLLAITGDYIKTSSNGSSKNGISLAPDFSDNFLSNKQEACPEIMMSVKHLAPNDYTSADQYFGDWVAVSPLANLISEFEYADGRPGRQISYTGNGKIDITTFTNDSLAVREPRAAKTIFMNKYVVNGVAYTPSNTRPTGAGVSKFLSTDVNLIPYDYATQSDQDWVLVRYADVLLMLAEAENELNGSTQLAFNAINAVRNRVGLPLLSGLDKANLRTKIRHERRIEFAFEGQRYFDLKRWKIAKQVLNNVTDGILTYNFLNKNYLWPLPQKDIDASGGVLVQNSDY
jgi:starch-binding outer membrane protein, SusD/RagB family